MKIHTHATSSKGNLWTVERKSDTIIIDAGVKRKVKGDILLVSHRHGDHSMYIDHYIDDVEHFSTTPEVMEDLKSARRMNAYTYQKMQAKYIPSFLLDIDTFETVHDVPSCGFIIYDGDKKVVHATDTAEMPKDEVMRNAEHYNIEANYDDDTIILSDRWQPLNERAYRTHMSNKNAVEWILWAIGDKTKSVSFNHVSSDTNYDGAIEELAKGIKCYKYIRGRKI